MISIIKIVELVRKLVDLRSSDKSSWLDAIKIQGTMVDLPVMEHLGVDSREISAVVDMVCCHHRERVCTSWNCNRSRRTSV